MTKEEFSVLFPKREIKYRDKIVATVKPIPISKMSEIIDNIKSIIDKVEAGIKIKDLAFTAIEDITKLIPYSIDKNLDDIPGTFLPEIFTAIVELNLNEVVIKNWLALLETIGKKMGELGGEAEKIADSGKQ